jgi:imidazoleglycerol-phosphate dehydratase/histidinol-phosphatase
MNTDQPTEKIKLLFIDRDGTLILEPEDQQIDSFEKLKFYPEAIHYLSRIARELDFQLVLVSNQDGLGTDSYPEHTFHPVHNFIIETLRGEKIEFIAQHIDRTFAHQQAPTRKPGTALLQEYFDENKYDLSASFVIGDRINDVILAQNLHAKAIWLNNNPDLGKEENLQYNQETVALETGSWKKVYEFLKLGGRKVVHTRKTNETDIRIELNLDGSGRSEMNTGLAFFDHMLDQLARHGGVDLHITTRGDLHIDEHHTIEDTAIALGEAFSKALGNKRGLTRYGFLLPMDDSLAQVAIDFGGRSWIVWDAEFRREMVGDMPTELFFHFFKSFSDAARCNLNIKVEGDNEHHKIESIFKAFAKAIKMAIRRDPENMQLPSTKGLL